MALIISGTASNPSCSVLKGTNKLILSTGFGSNFKIAFVIIPNVPSLPIISCFRGYPVESFTTFRPNHSISPLGKTTSIALTQSLVTPYLTARIPPALVAIFPPIVALFSPGSGA